MGLRRVSKWEKTDWYARYQQDAPPDALAWDDVHHVVIIPNYKEPEDVLRRTLDQLARQYEAQKRMTIVLAMEASESGCIAKAEMLQREYARFFANFHFTVHPRGLPGELQSKSPNQAWAARWIKRKLVDESGYSIDTILVTTMDADTLWHDNFFFALTYLFAINPRRHRCFWQGPIRYHANIWEINPLLRLVNAYATALELAYLAAPWWSALPMSSYSLSLRLLDMSGYWDGDVIADEWHMFIKAYFARDGDLDMVPVFLPFLATAPTGQNFLDAIKNRYQQTLRHAWGSKEVGFMIAKMIEHPEIPLTRTGQLLIRIAHDILLAGAGWVILTLGSQLPVLLHPGLAPFPPSEILKSPVWLLLSVSSTAVVILGIVFWYQDVLVRPPRSQKPTMRERFLTLLSFPLLPPLTVVLLALPAIQAQTRLLLGIPLQFRVTRKT
jgi:cellulose synthase/poly-beta-1,6-N-acetylglucosamine synthase-like glycosyltransferase